MISISALEQNPSRLQKFATIFMAIPAAIPRDGRGENALYFEVAIVGANPFLARLTAKHIAHEHFDSRDFLTSRPY
jgi:hypothetical protein